VEGDLNTEGLDLPEGTYEKLFALDPEAWSVEADLTEEYFAKFGDKVPAELHTQLEQLRAASRRPARPDPLSARRPGGIPAGPSRVSPTGERAEAVTPHR
jgi:hypothetical protein